MIILFLVFSVGAITYMLLQKNFNYWKNKNVPYVKPNLLFGNIWPLIYGKFHSSEFVRNLHNSRNVAFLGLFMFNRPYLLVKDLEIIKSILIKDFDHFMDRTAITSKHDKIGLNVLLVSKGYNWRTSRKTVSPAFTPGRLKNMLPLINDVCDDLIKYIEGVLPKGKGLVECREIYLKFGADVTSSCLFGLKANALKDESSEVFREISKLLEISLNRSIQTVSCFFIPQIVDVFNLTFLHKGGMKYLGKMFLQVIQARKTSHEGRNDLIDVLTELKQTNANNEFNEDHLVSLAISFLSAGYETLGGTLTFLLYELACNQNVQKRLRNELLDMLNHQELTYEAICKLKYLDMVISENLRKYPTLGFLDRHCVKTYQVPNTDLVIEKGVGIYISVLALHYDEQYFTNPNKFDPERFSDENKQSIPEFAYIPFGKGMRGCIGARFALLVMKLVTIRTVLNFQIDVCDQTPAYSMKFDVRGTLLAPPKGRLYLKFKRLQQ